MICTVCINVNTNPSGGLHNFVENCFLFLISDGLALKNIPEIIPNALFIVSSILL